MLRVNELKGEIKRNGLTLAETAKLIGISETTLWRKMKNNSFNLNEANALVRVLGIADPGHIFFGTD